MKKVYEKKNQTVRKEKKYNLLYHIGRFLLFIPCVTAIAVTSVTSTPAAYYTDIPGDINGDGIITQADISYILSCSSSTSSDFPKSSLKAADLNNDNKITAEDAYLAQKNLSSAVVIIEDDTKEPETTPLVDNKLTADDSGKPIQVAGTGESGYNVISSDKMYIYPDMSQVMQVRDNFVIVTFGWGHGVGMSQWGAIGLARAGYSYIQILQHFYNGVVIMKEQYPDTVRCAGRDVNTVEMLARIIQQEIAGITKSNDSLDINALRAQAVAAYTNMKFSGYSVSGCSYVSNYSSCRSDVKQVAAEMAGQYMTYHNDVIYAYYSSCSAGVSATYEQVWGNTNRDMSYLINSTAYTDCYTNEYLAAEVFSVESMRNYIKSYDSSIVLSDNPADWIKILRHDDAVNEQIGYVSAMQIGSKTISQGAGMIFRDRVLKYGIKSPCFAIVYNGQYL